MGQSPTSSNNPLFEKVKAFRRDKSPVSVSTPPRYSFKAPFTIYSNALRTQEWSDLTRDDVSRLRKTPPLVSILVGLVLSTLRTPVIHPTIQNQ
jgi:hypothetical protein